MDTIYIPETVVNRINFNGEKGCWLWLGWKNQDGYGIYILIHNHKVRVHRYIYELLNGKIPNGLVCDHQCNNPTCVNPNHIDIVTQKSNALRGIGMAAQNARKTHCKNGHKFTAENTYHNPSGNGNRTCKICIRNHVISWRSKRKMLGLPFR